MKSTAKRPGETPGWASKLKYGRKRRSWFGSSLGATIVGMLIVSPGVAGDWAYWQSKDEMTGKVTQYACVESENTLEFGFPYQGGTKVKLCLRKSPRSGNDVILSVEKGQFLCNPDDCRVRVKFDDQALSHFSATDAADGSTNVIFIDGFSRFLQGVKGAKTVLLSATFFQEGERVMQFDISNLAWSK